MIRYWMNLDWRSFFHQITANRRVSLGVSGPLRLTNSVGLVADLPGTQIIEKPYISQTMEHNA